MRAWPLALIVVAVLSGSAFAQEDKKTDDLKPADPDTGESTVEEETLGLLPNPFEKRGRQVRCDLHRRGAR
jgi:porin